MDWWIVIVVLMVFRVWAGTGGFHEGGDGFRGAGRRASSER